MMHIFHTKLLVGNKAEDPSLREVGTDEVLPLVFLVQLDWVNPITCDLPKFSFVLLGPKFCDGKQHAVHRK